VRDRSTTLRKPWKNVDGITGAMIRRFMERR
jgi:hypothetical protein